MWITEQLLVPIDFIIYLFILLFVCSLDKNTIEVNGDH